MSLRQTAIELRGFAATLRDEAFLWDRKADALEAEVDADTDTIEQRVLDTSMVGMTDLGVQTIREYLILLLTTVWEEQEGFNGKRPFGESSWDYDMIEALFQAGFLPGEHPEPGYGHTGEQDSIGHRLIADAIKVLR